METCSRIHNIDQIKYNKIMGYTSELKCNEQGTLHLPVSAPREVICPEPRRIARVPCCNPKRNFPFHEGRSSRDIFNLFLDMDEMEDELDTSSTQMDLFSSSPPVRTNNPLVRDVQFAHQTSNLGSSSGNTTRGTTSYAPSTREKPMIRIEGFNCGGSKSHSISALVH